MSIRKNVEAAQQNELSSNLYSGINMEFNPDNEVVKLCSQGMEQEGQGNPEDARNLFERAWTIASTDLEKFTAAHYLARQQEEVSEKLHWDKIALAHALKIKEDAVKASLPSLYLNIGKCYEDLSDFENASENYNAALSYGQFLPDNGYGALIKKGIVAGIERLNEQSSEKAR